MPMKLPTKLKPVRRVHIMKERNESKVIESAIMDEDATTVSTLSNGVISTSSSAKPPTGPLHLQEVVVAGNTNAERQRLDLVSKDNHASLRTRKQLYGREMEQKKVSELYQKRDLRVIFISGPSGTGKTFLAESLRDRVKSDGGFFVTGKCEVLQKQGSHEKTTKTTQLEPYGPFITALTDFLEQLDHLQKCISESIREEICDTLSDYELHVLQSIIPRISDLLTEHAEEEASFVAKNPKIVKLALRKLLQLIGRSDRPLVLCLDDLQWADKASTELLDDIIQVKSDKECNRGGLLILACFREDELAESTFHLDTLFGMDDTGMNKDAAKTTSIHARVTRIALGALSFDSVAEMTANYLGLSQEESLPLTKLIYHHSKGNAFMIYHSLRAFQNDKIASLGDDASLQEDFTMDDSGFYITKMMVRILQKLPVATSHLLTVASCLHTEFSAKLLHQATYDPNSSSSVEKAVTNVDDIESALIPAVEKGLIWQHREAYVFAHDKVKEAAYSLIRLKEDEKKFLLEVGRRLQSNFTNHEMVKNIFLWTKLLSPGVDLMYKEEERENLVVLCLAAGRQATRSSSFATALEYIEFGISLLGRRNWRDQYELSLELYNAASELSFCTGHHDKVDELVESVLCNAKSFEDEMQAHRSKILSLGSRGKYSMACELGFDLLRKLGHPMSSKAGALRVKMDLWRIQRKLKRISDTDIINLPMMSDAKVIACMSILHLLHGTVATYNPVLTCTLSVHMVNLTLTYGLSAIGCAGFGLYGLTLARMGDGHNGYRYGMVAFHLLDKLNARELASKTRLSMAVGGQTMMEPFRKALNSMVVASEIGMKTGDIETGVRSLSIRSVLRYNIGDPLDDVSANFSEIEDLCAEYGLIDAKVMREWTDGLRFLMGEIQYLPGKEALQAYMNDEGSSSRPPGVYMLCGWFCSAAYMNDLDFSMSLVTLSRKLNYDFSWLAPSLFIFQTFFEATVEAGIIQHSKANRFSDRGIKKVKQLLEKLRNAARHCPENFLNKVYLVEADLDIINKKYDRALIQVGKSIKLAEEQGFVNEEALAYEKIGRMEMLRNRDSEAKWYLTKSINLYERWGAKAKTEQLGRILSQFSSQ